MAFVNFTFNPVPAPACYPPDLNGLAEELTTGGILSGEVPDNAGGGIFVGAAAPSSSLTNKVWFKIDSAARPLGIYMFYNGNWRKVYTGVVLGELRFYSGASSVFDGTGRGIVGGDVDGWALCNGQNGTFNLQDKFLVASTQYGAGWQANPSGLGGGNSGGRSNNTIQCNNLPDLFAVAQLATIASSSGGLNVASPGGGAGSWDISVNDLVNNCHCQGQVPFDNTPPWYACALMQFVGYQ